MGDVRAPARRPGWWPGWPKRAFDVAAASGALIVLAPLLGVTALAIRLVLGRPVIFAQRRPGRHARPWERRFELDVWYVEHQSLRLDVWILLLTMWKAVAQVDVSQPGEGPEEHFRGRETATDAPASDLPASQMPASSMEDAHRWS